MTVVLPIVAMVFFSVLYVGAYAWMRRPKFGESEKRTVRVDSRSIVVLSNPTDDHRTIGLSRRDVRDGSKSTHEHVGMHIEGACE